MIKTILGLVINILKNKTYMTAAKEVWGIVDETFRITSKVEEKLKSKEDEFDKLLLAKFPELTQDYLEYFRQAVAGMVNKDKVPVITNDEVLKQLQKENEKLKAENTELNNKIAQMQNIVTVNTVQA